MGGFVPYNYASKFVQELTDVKNRIDELIKTKPARAVLLYEIFIAGCYEKIEEIDDSGGDLGQFAEGLFCSWVKARQAMKADPVDTIRRLLTWIKNDDYGFCYKLEEETTKVLNKNGLKAFRAIIEDGSLTKINAIKTKSAQEQQQIPYELQNDISTLKAIYREQCDISSYCKLCEQTGYQPDDCETLANIYKTRGKFDAALEWVERGLNLSAQDKSIDFCNSSLKVSKRELLKKLGRNSVALESAWADYRNCPSSYSYEELLRYIPKKDKTIWHQKIVATLETAPLESAIEVYIITKELNLLAKRILETKKDQLKDYSHYTTQPAAEVLEKACPAAAAKIYECLGFRILMKGKSKYYSFAHNHFQKAKNLYESQGLVKDWQKIVEDIRENHRRKSSFVVDFERITSGMGTREDPTFYKEFKKECKPDEWAVYEPHIINLLEENEDDVQSIKIRLHRNEYDLALQYFKKPRQRPTYCFCYEESEILSVAKALESRYPDEILLFYKSNVGNLNSSSSRKTYHYNAQVVERVRRMYVDVMNDVDGWKKYALPIKQSNEKRPAFQEIFNKVVREWEQL